VSVHPTLRYHDARSAIDWLERAFGFSALAVHDGPGDTVAHAELAAADGVIMLGSEPEDGAHAGHGWTYVAIENPDELHDRAVAAGAEIVRPLEDTDYGSRDFTARDPEGNLWSFGTYRPR
jgi:uncharacterized glyoxalase superfamily protein PhnB